MEDDKIDIIDSKIVTKQLELDNEKDQTKKNKILNDLKILKMRKDMETTHDSIKKLTNRD